jgi:PPM family protein phosphatase
LYQSLGIKREIDIQARGAFPLEKGHKYLLCSDGLHGVIPDPEIEYYLKGKSTVRTAEQLVQQAKSNGGPDNITVIVVSTEPDVAAGISDTVKIIAPAFKKKKSRAWFFILLILLILLLSLVIYFLLRSADTRVASLTPLEDLAEKSVTVETVVPAVLPGKG